MVGSRRKKLEVETPPTIPHNGIAWLFQKKKVVASCVAISTVLEKIFTIKTTN
jgi:hypothetical protein